MTRRNPSEQILQCSDRFDVRARVVYDPGWHEEKLTEGGFGYVQYLALESAPSTLGIVWVGESSHAEPDAVTRNQKSWV